VKTISLKKVSAVAVASLGFGLLSVVPAEAVGSQAITSIVSNQTMVRTDDTAYDDVIGGEGDAFGLTSTEGTTNEFDGAKVTVTYKANSTATEVAISTVNASSAPAAAATETETLGTGVTLALDNGTTGTNTFGAATAGVYTISGSADSAAANVLQLNLARNATPGIYTLKIDGNADGDFTDATGTDDTASIMIADMPNSVSFTNSVSLTSAGTRIGDGTATYSVKVKDAGGRESYLRGSERVRFAVTGGSGSGVTITTPALPAIGSGDLTTTATGRAYSLTATAASAAGSYTITGTMEGFATTWTTTPGTASLTVTSAANVKTTATVFALTAAGCNDSATVFNDTCTTDVGAATRGTSAVTNYMPLSTRDISVKASFATSVTGDARFEVSASTIAGIDAGTVVLATIVAGPVVNTATYTFKASYATADASMTVEVGSTAANAANVLELTATYKAPVAGYLEIAPDTANIRTAAAGSTVISAAVTDQFGNPMSNQGVNLTTTSGSRNASLALAAVTNASGVASFTVEDKYTGTALTTDALTVQHATVAAATDSINIVYGAKTSGAITVAVTQPTTPGTTTTYATTITTSTAPTVTVDDTPDSTNNNADELDIADQVAVTGTVVDATAATIQGQKVTVTGTSGVFFKSGSTLGDVDLTVATRKATIDLYTNSSGQVGFQAAFTKSGTATITLTSGTATKTYSISVSAGTARNITLTNDGPAVTVSATDAWGNGVAKAVTLSASGIGRFTNGVAYNSLTLPTTGKAVYDVIGAGAAGTTTITAAMTADATNTALADATYGFPAGSYTVSKDISVVSGQSETQKLMTQIDALNAKVVALNALIAKIMKKLGVR
jgi:hypothetical protein